MRTGRSGVGLRPAGRGLLLVVLLGILGVIIGAGYGDH